MASDPSEAPQAQSQTSRDAAYWAKPVVRLTVSNVPAGAVNLNVQGRRLAGALQGFGQMWQKTYRIRLEGAQVTPAHLITIWKEEFPSFWPTGNAFYGPLTGVAPGEVGLINLSQGPMKLSTGVMVLYADDESFTFMNPEGHMFSGWITFSAYEQAGCTVAQVQVLIRASDPAWEVAMRLFGYKKEDAFWHHTLENLAARFDVAGQAVQQQSLCVDPKLQWAYAGNIWKNAAMWSGLYMMTAPFRWAAGPFRRRIGGQ